MTEAALTPSLEPQTEVTQPAVATAPTASATAASVPIDTKHRKHTWGEIAFDLLVYGGIGWAINTGVSVLFADWFRNGGKHLAEKGVHGFDNAWAKIIKDPKTRRKVAENNFFISTIYTGGTLLVIPMRMIEDHKASLVRKFDHWIHGDKIYEKPEVQQAHEAMDRAPKQSYPSLLIARILALPVGIGLGMLVGDVNAPSTKLFNAEWMNRGPIKARDYSSFSRASMTLTRDFAAKFFPHLREGVAEAKRLSPYAELAHESRGIKLGFLAVYDLLLSFVVASGFYVTSKAFAKVIAHMQHPATTEASGPTPAAIPISLSENAFDRTEQPSTQIVSQGPLNALSAHPATRVTEALHQHAGIAGAPAFPQIQ